MYYSGSTVIPWKYLTVISVIMMEYMTILVLFQPKRISKNSCSNRLWNDTNNHSTTINNMIVALPLSGPKTTLWIYTKWIWTYYIVRNVNLYTQREIKGAVLKRQNWIVQKDIKIFSVWKLVQWKNWYEKI